MTYNFDELSASNVKILLSIVSSIFLVLSIISAKNVADVNLIFSIFNYYAANALAFYCVNTKVPEIQKRKNRIINIYILCSIVVVIFVKIYNVTENIKFLSESLAFVFKSIAVASCFINVIFAIKDDESGDYEDLHNTKKNVKKKIKQDVERKKYTNRDKNVKMNAETKRFIEKTENRREGRRL